jgi:hypothetical protein
MLKLKTWSLHMNECGTSNRVRIAQKNCIVSVIQFNLATKIALNPWACCRLLEYNYNQGLQGLFLIVVLGTYFVTEQEY